MSYFPDNIIYVIVPTADITNEMENNMKMSYNGDKDSIRKNTGDTKRIFKLIAPVNDVFMGYKWYSHKDILAELENAEWQS